MPEDILTEARVLPANFGPLRGANGNARITGPCGDTMEFWIFAEDGRIVQATFTTDGCGPSIMSGNAAASLAEGKTIQEAVGVSQEDVLNAVGGLPEEFQHCALLAANTLHSAVADYRAKHGKKGSDLQTCESGTSNARMARPGEKPNEIEAREALHNCLSRIKHKVVVLSGKGGVGKSTVAVNLAVSLVLAGKRVGLLDVDFHGPSVPKMLGLEGTPIQGEMGRMVPVELDGLKVMSIGFLLRDQDDAVIWRGPMKMRAINQFLKDVEWGDLDYLIVDAPPGTGDEPLSVCQLIEDADGAVVVTTPQDVAVAAVRKSITFCRQLKLPVLGVIENMSGLACPHCNKLIGVFKSGGGERMAREMNVPFLGRIPVDPAIGETCDAGKPYISAHVGSETAKAFACVVRPILELSGPLGGGETDIPHL